MPPDRLVEYLQNSQKINAAGCTVEVQKHLTRLSQDIQNPEVFMSKYNDLKEKKYNVLYLYEQSLNNDFISVWMH